MADGEKQSRFKLLIEFLKAARQEGCASGGSVCLRDGTAAARAQRAERGGGRGD